MFLARPPLYRVVALRRLVRLRLDARTSCARRSSATRRTGEHVTRFKGLGEMNPDQLRETVFDPATRRLLQVTFEDAAHVAETVKLLMGNDARAARARGSRTPRPTPRSTSERRRAHAAPPDDGSRDGDATSR